MRKIYDIIPLTSEKAKKAVFSSALVALSLFTIFSVAFFFSAHPQETSAASGDVIVLWDGASIPSGWTCISCATGDPFFGAFPMGSSTYANATSGSDTAAPAASFVSMTGASASVGINSGNGTGAEAAADTHTVSGISVAPSDIRPPYQDLELISAPTTTLPNGAIAIFDTSSSSLPASWSYYSAMAGKYLRAAGDAATGGSTTHVHTVTASLDASTADLGTQNGGSQVSVAAGSHTHTISGNITDAAGTPPFLNVVFAQLTATSSIPTGMIAMFDAALPAGWTSVSGAGQDFSGRFLQGSDSYGATGGVSTVTDANTTITSGAPSATVTTRSGSTSQAADPNHTHDVTFSFSAESIIPVNRGVIFAKKEPTVTIGSTGSQIATTSIPSSGFYVGGAFTLVRDSATATVSQIIVTASGTLNANANLSNLFLYYETAVTCATSSVPGTAVQFNSAGASFNGSEQATATGTILVGTSQVCVYAKVDVGSGAGGGQIFQLEVENPSTDVTVDSGGVSPATAIALGGQTTMPSTSLTEQDFEVYANTDAVQPTSSLAAENASATEIISGEAIRIRANIAVSGAPLATSSQAFKLQYASKGSAATCALVPSVDFTDVGASSSNAAWRGFNNTSTADGAALTATLLPSSTVAESYAEQNPTAANPKTIPVGGAGEWDFAVQDHAASSSAAYCFRMTTDTGVALDGYDNYPEVDTIPAATWRASEDAPSSTIEDTSIRLRMEISNNGNANDSGAFQLEFATSTVGPWTTVPVDSTCSITSAAFRECSSNYFVDLDPTHNLLTPAAASFISGYLLEGTNPAPSLTLNTNQFTELAWNIQATEAAVQGQIYYFRATDAGTSIGTYSVFPQLTVIAASSTFTQNYYRWYANANTLKPTDPWPAGATDLGENTAITASNAPPKNGDVLRLRISAVVDTATLATSTQAFKLQYGARTSTCSAVNSWSDVGAIGGAGAWRGFDNASVTDGAVLSTDPPTAGDLVLSVSDRSGVYAEANPSAVNPFKANIGDNVEYDWVLQDESTSSASSYCFRMVQSDGTALAGYTYYPTVTTAAFEPQSANWRFYDDENNETPTDPLAGENVSPSNVDNGNIIKLRMAIKAMNGVAGNNVKFKLQYSTFSDFSSGVSDVAETGSCSGSSGWCYATSTGGTDNAIITAAVLSGADTCSSGVGNGCGTHNTSGVSSSTATQAANATTEYEFTIVGDGATANTTYFFRLVNTADGNPVALNGSSSYPSLVTEGSLLTFTVGGLPQGTSTDGVITSISSTPTSIPFGMLTIASSAVAAQQLSISTNAPNGFELYALQDSPLTNGGGYTMPGVAATNNSPLPWSSACTATSTACYGYHPGSPVLSDGSTRFAADDTYAALTSTPAEIGYSGAPATSTIDVIYRVQAGATQVNGTYQNNIMYIAAPIF